MGSVLISRQETENPAHLDKRSKLRVSWNSRFDLLNPKAFSTIVFQNSTAMCLVHSTVRLGQPGGLFKKAYLYSGANWLGSSVIRGWREVNWLRMKSRKFGKTGACGGRTICSWPRVHSLVCVCVFFAKTTQHYKRFLTENVKQESWHTGS